MCSQELTRDTVWLSQEFISEMVKKSKDLATEASKKADVIKIEALKRAEQIKTLTGDILIQSDPRWRLIRLIHKRISRGLFHAEINPRSPRMLLSRMCGRISMNGKQDMLLLFSRLLSYEKLYMEELHVNVAEQSSNDRLKENLAVVPASKGDVKETKLDSKASSSNAEHDLDVFLLGDLGSDDDDGPGISAVDDDGFDDDFVGSLSQFWDLC
ncbi:hypothetical protein J5N97_026469 [Dioscorea zingiberensis]|uniref:Uncharacterized protein n=1 Tax=Dioscorea zingiberensis TaxID=325984 RepID=A0A9D5C255_9LILI|nr:hypothetical protein J5N97_026469 [Dioscorea zingiberensis]